MRPDSRFKKQEFQARTRDTYSSEKPDPVEIVLSLLNPSAFLMPSEGKGTAAARITPADAAGGVGGARDDVGARNHLGAAILMACAGQYVIEWPTIRTLGYGRLLASLERQYRMPGVVEGDARYRTLAVLQDAYVDLVRLRKGKAVKEKAKDARMGEHPYRFIYRAAESLLKHERANAARDVIIYLFSTFDAPSAEPQREHALVPPVRTHIPHAPDTAIWRLMDAIDRNPLSRSPGILSLRNREILTNIPTSC